MAKTPLRNLFTVIQIRFLQTKATPSPKSSSVVNCLKSHGFEDTHIADLLKKRPDVLNCNVNAKLRPKLQFLIDNGFQGKHLPALILSNPVLLFRGLDSQIKPCFDFLRPILNDDQQMLAAIKRSSWLLASNVKSVLKPNVDLLVSQGIPVDRVSKLLILQPRVIIQSHERMVYAVNAVKEIGVDPKNPMFIHALRVMCSMSESNWEKKLRVYMSLGWSSRDQVLNTFRKDPLCLACSEKKLRGSMDFYLNTMKLDPKIIIAYPKLLLYADKRVRARYMVYKVLEEKELIKGKRKLVWLITMPERNFLAEYIARYSDQVPGLLELYYGIVKQRKTIGGKKDKSSLKSASLSTL